MSSKLLFKPLQPALLAAALLLWGTTTGAAAPPPEGVQAVQTVEGISEYRLPNGLKVLLAPDAADQRVTVNLTYKVGSRHEGYGETGMAHLLEHLIFKGTPTTPDPKAEFRRRGLNFNGSTTADRTNYFANFVSEPAALDWYLRWQADAMTNSFIAKKDLDDEMTVVRSEYEMGENNPVQTLVARMAASAYGWHNYGKSTIGARSDIENVDIGRLQAFYRRYYRPDNATLIIAGRFEPSATLARVAAAFAAVPRPQGEVPATYTLEPAQDGERAVVVRRPAAVQMLVAGYHTPPALHPDSPALDVLSLVLGDAPGGRLHKALVETRLAQSVFAVPQPRREAGTYYFGAALGPADDAAQRQAVLLNVVEGLAGQPVTPEEFERAKTKYNKSVELMFASAARLAAAAIDADVMGDWRAVFAARERLQRISLDDVNRVARTYLLRDNRTLGHLVPTERPQRAPAPAPLDPAAFVQGFAFKENGDASAAFDFSPASLQRQAVLHTSAGGVHTAVLNKPIRGGLVHFQMHLRLGDLPSLAGAEFAGNLAGAALLYGTDRMSRQQIDDALVRLGARLQVNLQADGGTVGFIVKKEQFAATLELVAHVLQRAAYPDDQIEQARAGWLKGLAGQVSDQESQTREQWRRYGNPYPASDYRYPWPSGEMIPKVQALTATQVRDFHRRFYGADGALVTVVGPVEPAQVQAQLAALLDGWRAPQAYQRVPHPLYAKAPARLRFDTPDKANASIEVQMGVALNQFEPDSFAMGLGARILGGGPGSRLWHRLRESTGLSYSAGAYFDAATWDSRATLALSAEVNPRNLGRAEAALREELDQSVAQGFSDGEVEGFKRQWLSDRQRERSGDAWAAGALHTKLEFGKPWELWEANDRIIAALTAQQVNAVWRRFVQPGQAVWGVFADPAQVR